MKTQKAIEFLEDRKYDISSLTYSSKIWFLEDYNQKCDDIIILLQQGENYRLIVAELEARHSGESINEHCPEGLKDAWLFIQEIKLLKKKYFPKETNEYKEGEE